MKAMLDQLARWVAAGWLRDLDQAFADFLAREAGDAEPLLLLAAALASHQLGRGHACLDLQATLDDGAAALALPPEETEALEATPADLLAGVSLTRWQQALAHPRLVGSGPGSTPLVLEGARLYLRRYWQHERTVQQAIAQRLALPQPAADNPGLRAALDVLFPPAAAGGCASGSRRPPARPRRG